ncbi:hypothetical protein LR48_Vigan03g037200 [Vigna angularis]|uniref:Uncharacterized protein n=1 Tax=Phaseolus angularis TaxID=3914 RepID=A0A0L9U2K1_PHAAN|nr:hypothetical protein LR48_Vigan03g037200 [Vigna angularis]
MGTEARLHCETWSVAASYHGGAKGDDGLIQDFVGLWRRDACTRCCVVSGGIMVFTHGGDCDEGFRDFRGDTMEVERIGCGSRTCFPTEIGDLIRDFVVA